MNQLSDELMEQANDVNVMKDELSPVEPMDVTTVTSLNDLNEDCLLQIFSVKSLTQMDLCSLAESCRRFRTITQRIAQKRLHIYADFIFTRGCEVAYHLRGRQVGRNDIGRFFRNFGSRLSEVDIMGIYDISEPFLLQLITKYCSDGSLKRFTLYKFDIPDVLANGLRPIFNQLQELLLVDVVILADNTTHFANLDSLIELSLHCVMNCGVILENSFPKLERFEYTLKATITENGRERPYNPHNKQQIRSTLSTFISRHQKLKRLWLDFSSINFQMDVLQSIRDNCKDLEKLSLFIQPDNVFASLHQPFEAFKSLQFLYLSNFSFEDFEFLSPLTALRTLMLSKCHLPHESKPFPCLPHLRELTFDSSYVIDVVCWISQLENLEAFLYGNRLNEETIKKIIAIVRGRPKILTLESSFSFDVNKYADNPHIRFRESISRRF